MSITAKVIESNSFSAKTLKSDSAGQAFHSWTTDSDVNIGEYKAQKLHCSLGLKRWVADNDPRKFALKNIPLIIDTWKRHEKDSLFNALKSVDEELNRPEGENRKKGRKKKKKVNTVKENFKSDLSTEDSTLSNDQELGVSKTINISILPPTYNKDMSKETLNQVVDRVKLHEQEILQLKLEGTSSRLALYVNTVLDKRLMKKKKKGGDEKMGQEEETAGRYEKKKIKKRVKKDQPDKSRKL